MALTISQSHGHITIIPDLHGIAGMSRAAALVVTWTAHGLTTGDYVSFQGITTPADAGEWIALNGNSYPVTVLTADTFSIPVDSSGFTAAYVDANDLGRVGTDFDISRIQSSQLHLGTIVGAFTAGETVTQATTGATGVVYSWQLPRLDLISVWGTFDAANTITGGTSSATGIPNRVDQAYPAGLNVRSIDFGSSESGDSLVVRHKTAYGPIVFTRHIESGDAGFPRSVGSLKRPYIKASDQIWAVPANVQIVLRVS